MTQRMRSAISNAGSLEQVTLAVQDMETATLFGERRAQWMKNVFGFFRVGRASELPEPSLHREAMEERGRGGSWSRKP